MTQPTTTELIEALRDLYLALPTDTPCRALAAEKARTHKLLARALPCEFTNIEPK